MAVALKEYCCVALRMRSRWVGACSETGKLLIVLLYTETNAFIRFLGKLGQNAWNLRRIPWPDVPFHSIADPWKSSKSNLHCARFLSGAFETSTDFIKSRLIDLLQINQSVLCAGAGRKTLPEWIAAQVLMVEEIKLVLAAEACRFRAHDGRNVFFNNSVHLNWKQCTKAC